MNLRSTLGLPFKPVRLLVLPEVSQITLQWTALMFIMPIAMKRQIAGKE